MIEEIRKHVKALIEEQKIAAFLGLKDQAGNIVPHLYESVDALGEGFSIGEGNSSSPFRYPLASLLMTLVQTYADKTFGVLVRGCDERAINELLRWNQIPAAAERIVTVGLACPAELAKDHECRKPFPDTFVAGEKAEPVAYESVREVMVMDLSGRLAYWLGEFDRCIKCYGCRDVCPVCFCNVCTLEEDVLIKTGDLPPENPMFHLTRAVHMAGRCIDCNLCTEACPAQIPLRTLYKKVAEIVRDEFGYISGEQDSGKSPLNILGPQPGHTSANE
jgi:ferredoxin